jgi:hypothetical protein
MLHRSKSLGALGAALMLAGLAAPSLAASNAWDVDVNPGNGFGGATAPWVNGAADTAFAAWNVFDGYPADATPDAGSFGPAPQSVVEHSGGAFLSGGNIYSFAVPTDFTVTLTGYAPAAGTRTVAIRTESLGTEIDYASMLLNGVSAARVETFRGALGGFGGQEVESFWLWHDLANAAAYVFEFNAAGSSMSLSQVAAYVSPLTPVPEPGTWALMAGGLALVGALRARRGLA